jgi:hypothetical protein
MEKMESEKEITHFDGFVCFLEHCHFLNGTNSKAIVKGRHQKKAVIVGCCHQGPSV